MSGGYGQATAEISAPSRPGPDPRAMWEWLRSGDVVLPDGGVQSWSNPAHPGYRYPEAAGLFLSLGCQLSDAGDPLLERVCTGLAADVAPSGGVGRGGQQYLFDTAIALSALLAWRGIGGRLPDPALPHRLFAFIQRLVAERRAVDPRQGGDSDRWSLRFGAHLLKVALAINAYHDHFGVPECRTLVNALTDDLLPLERDGRFVTFAGSRETYTHASCYALEGLLDITRRGLGDHREVIDRGADWLVECQGTSGGLHAWHDGERFQGPIHSDATAQAVRIWLLADPARFRAPVSRALAFLADQQAPAGGIYYRDGSGDVNTWATIFAVQAVQWSAGGDRGALV